ncbi:hypothetical protein GGX14DRAFT_451074 [Mycena pura]|uniref:C3H1-type domain-containing protein n=1 Tax=Mycena pura TaxID=153505 RepID=A0AAD6VIG3_9AGAR|nr:hypothetical protein GGX14DRAFT_451074 [Mycena pura]
MASEAQIKSEIARLTASINQHKSATSKPPPRSNSYINPNYRPPANKYIRPSTTTVLKAPISQSRPTPSTQVKEVVLNGVAFESSRRSLVRKDLPKPSTNKTTTPQPPRPRPHFLTNPGARVYKPKASRGRRLGPVNMTLANGRRPFQSRRQTNKRLKYSDKPCPRFTTTGSCSRGLTCLYQHDPAKIAVCWNFLQGSCPNTAETCNLSHEPTPERTPLCLHFLNKGRCTRDGCPFPHVNVGARQGVCRDFAVLGYCERGLDCDKQHVRECPDFAERGTCATRGCKLPHVIRANRNRKAPAPAAQKSTSTSTSALTADLPTAPSLHGVADSSALTVTAEDAQLGDEYISLTFNESESSEEDDESDEEETDDDEAGVADDGVRDSASPPGAIE